MSGDNYFVVPKRALFLQSIVNLKILKREADKLSKTVVIVTQDEVATAMAKRSGIEVRATVDGLGVSPEVFADQTQYEDDFEQELDDAPPLKKSNHLQDKQIRLSSVGSGDYYQSNDYQDAHSSRTSSKREPKEMPVISAAKTSKRIGKEVAAKKISPKMDNINIKKGAAVRSFKHDDPKTIGGARSRGVYGNQLDPHKAQTLEKMFSPHDYHSHGQQEEHHDGLGNGKMRKVLVGFLLLCVVVFMSAAGYLFIPSAKITVKSDVQKKKMDMEIKAAQDVSGGESTVPLRVIEKELQISIPYDVAGSSSEIAGKKSHGTVVIYNEYSAEPQTLVATTRLESVDGKIFRLVKNVVVPGLSNVGGQSKPGAIEAEIIADSAGSDYNIDPTKFTVPGFAGGPKFDKFYATSNSATTGGGGTAQTVSGTVSQEDFDSAKQKTENIFKEKARDEIKSQLTQGDMFLQQAEKIDIVKSSPSVRIGTMTDSFEWVVSGSIRALVFSENDVKKIMSQSLKADQQSGNVKTEISKMDYGSVEPDFEASSLKLRVYGEVMSTPVINIDQLKQDLLGKKDDQLGDVLRKYTAIKNANVEFSPSFVSRIPQYSSRVSIEIEKETN